MPTKTTFLTPLPRKPKLTRYLVAMCLALVAAFFFQLLGPNPAILISRPTTYITSPLSANGLPDYARYVRERYAAGVTPDSNAAILLWQAVKLDDLDAGDIPIMCQALGITTAPTDPNRLGYFVDQRTEELVDWYGEKLDLDESRFMPWSEDIADQIVATAQKTPWKATDVPALSRWLDRHRSQIELIFSASQRAKLYMPNPTLLHERDQALIGTWPAIFELAYPASTALSLNAMRHLGEGRDADAWSDILALFRLASLYYAGPSRVDFQRGLMIENTALDATLAFLTANNVSTRQVQQAIRDLTSLPPIPDPSPHIDCFERIQALDTAIRIAEGRTAEVIEPLELGNQVTVFDYVSVDWNIVLRGLNELFDRLVTVTEQPDYESRRQALRAFDSHLTELGKPHRDLAGLARVTFSRSQRNHMLAVAIFSLTWSYVPVEQIAQAESRRNLARIVGGLAFYHHRHDEFPRRLAELVPDFLAELPVDPFSSNPYYYRRGKLGYLLYSAGPNTFDDGGSNYSYSILAGRQIEWTKDEAMQKLLEQIPHNADDLSIRLPTPPFQLPPPPK